MTAFRLLLWINAAIAIQVAMFGAIAFWRHWRRYQALRVRALEQGVVGVDAPVEDIVVPRATAAWDGFREFVVQRKEFEDASGSVCSVYLVPADGRPLPPFQPGQFLTFRIDADGPGPTGKPIIRCYSLSDRPVPEYYRISVKRLSAPPTLPSAAPGAASGYIHDRLKAGDRLSARAPSGHFHLQEGVGPIVLVAGGIGITPLLGIMNSALHADPGREVWLFYGVRDGAEHAMKAHLEAMAARHPSLHLHVCYSRPSTGDVEGRDYHHRGHVDLALLRAVLPLHPFHFYVCGPRRMMESLVPALEEWGVASARIHYEAFGPASLAGRRRGDSPTVPAGATVAVTFARSGTRALWDGSSSSLLEFAEGLGLKIDSGCRAGSCGTCRVTLESGEVQYEQRPEFDPAPGECLLCISRPRTDIVLQA